jgi:hypothetical protein
MDQTWNVVAYGHYDLDFRNLHVYFCSNFFHMVALHFLVEYIMCGVYCFFAFLTQWNILLYLLMIKTISSIMTYLSTKTIPQTNLAWVFYNVEFEDYMGVHSP